MQRNVVVTGATSGIGFEVARALVSHGHVVGINGRSEARVKDTCEQLGSNAIPCAFNVADAEAVQAALFTFHKQRGGLQGLIHCAGIMQSSVLGMATDEEIDHIIRTNLIGAINVVQTSSRLMRKKRSGSIVLIGSIAGIEGAAGQAVYAASKAGVAALALSAAKELGEFEVRVNLVVPGIIDTPLTRELTHSVIERNLERIPMNRLGHASDVQGVCRFLLSEEAAYITGSTIRVDGGLRL